VLLSRVPSEVANERVEYLAGYASVWSPSVRLIRHVPLRRDFRLTRERYAIKREQDPGFSVTVHRAQGQTLRVVGWAAPTP